MAFIAQTLKEIAEENLTYVFNGSKDGKMDEKFRDIKYFEYIVLGSIVKREMVAEIADLAKRIEESSTLIEGVETAHKLSDYAEFQEVNEETGVCTDPLGLLFDYCKHRIGAEGWECAFNQYDDIVIPLFTIPSDHIADKETYTTLCNQFIEGMIGEDGIVARFNDVKARLNESPEDQAVKADYDKVLEDAVAVYKPWLSYLLLVIVQNPDLMHGAIGNFSFMARGKNVQSDMHVYMHKTIGEPEASDEAQPEAQPTANDETTPKAQPKKLTKVVRFSVASELYTDDYETKGQWKFHWRIETVLRHRVNVEDLSEDEFLSVVEDAIERLETRKVVRSRRVPEPNPEPEPIDESEPASIPLQKGRPGRKNKGRRVDVEAFIGGQKPAQNDYRKHLPRREAQAPRAGWAIK